MTLPEISHPILEDIEDKLDIYLNEKVPHIPADAKATIVRYLPVGLIIIIVAQLASILSFFEINSLFAGLGYLYGIGTGVIGFIGIILLGIAVFLEVVAIPMLFRHQRLGWKYAMYAVLISQINDLLNLNLINLIFSGLLLLYVLFQVKENYR